MKTSQIATQILCIVLGLTLSHLAAAESSYHYYTCSRSETPGQRVSLVLQLHEKDQDERYEESHAGLQNTLIPVSLSCYQAPLRVHNSSGGDWVGQSGNCLMENYQVCKLTKQLRKIGVCQRLNSYAANEQLQNLGTNDSYCEKIEKLVETQINSPQTQQMLQKQFHEIDIRVGGM